MKKFFLALSFTLLLCFFTAAASAQTDEETTEITSSPTPKWVSKNGYWVVQSNNHSPKVSVVYFYNNENELVYKENVNGVVINLKKRRVKMDLKKVLEQSVLAFNQKQKAAENDMLVMNLLKK